MFTCLALGLGSCSKDNDTDATANMRMHLTDGPADYDAIYLDVQAVEINMSGSTWITLHPMRPGIYDILRFSNGEDTILTNDIIPTGRINQIRLVLGSNNSIVVDGVTHPLTVPSGQTSGVKVNFDMTFQSGNTYDVWLDFDAATSIVATGSGKYQLKPVIRAFAAAQTGIIKGYLLPAAAGGTVYAINGTDTFSAIPDPLHAYFSINGLPPGTYNMWFKAGVPLYLDEWQTNISVTAGSSVDLGTIVLDL